MNKTIIVIHNDLFVGEYASSYEAMMDICRINLDSNSGVITVNGVTCPMSYTMTEWTRKEALEDFAETAAFRKMAKACGFRIFHAEEKT